MLKPGFVAALGVTTPCNLLKMFNGMNEADKHLDPFGGGPPMATIDGAKVVRVFDEHWPDAELLSALCDVPEVADSLEEMFEGIDAVFIGDDLKFTQYRFARSLPRTGHSRLARQALCRKRRCGADLIDCARDHGSLFMSTSAQLRAEV